LLVLGSLPGEESLAQGRYYAHPRNHFWTLIGAVIGRDLVALGYEARLAALLEAGVGLWDVVASATRRGSLDGAIRVLRRTR
jgi:hypoxanthine-DNA glycosylase